MEKHIIYDYEPLWGNWYVDQYIGEGSTGNVYKVKRDFFDKVYYSAVKVISFPSNQQYLSVANSYKGIANEYFKNAILQLTKEIDLLHEFKGHSNILSYEDHLIQKVESENKWHIFIRMELAQDLYDYVGNRELTENEVIKIGLDICQALKDCHDCDIMHRDIKEKNIFVSARGSFKLGDFSVSKMLKDFDMAKTVVGTLNYMPPEVLMGKTYTKNADIYSLGIVLYKLLNNGRFPFLPESQKILSTEHFEIAQQKRLAGETIKNPVMGSPELIKVVLKACSYNPEERYSNAREMIDDLNFIKLKKENSIRSSKINNKNSALVKDKKPGILSSWVWAKLLTLMSFLLTLFLFTLVTESFVGYKRDYELGLVMVIFTLLSSTVLGVGIFNAKRFAQMNNLKYWYSNSSKIIIGSIISLAGLMLVSGLETDLIIDGIIYLSVGIILLIVGIVKKINELKR